MTSRTRRRAVLVLEKALLERGLDSVGVPIKKMTARVHEIERELRFMKFNRIRYLDIDQRVKLQEARSLKEQA